MPDGHKKPYTHHTPTEKWEKQLRKISKKYNVEIEEHFSNDFTLSVINQFRERGTLTERQVQALVNCSEGIKEYEENQSEWGERSRHNPNRSCGWDCDEGYWDDLGSMGYLN